MKRLLLALILSLFLAVGAFAGDETVLQYAVPSGSGSNRKVTVTFDITGDSINGSIPDTDFNASVMNYIKGLHLTKVTADPGTTAPTVDSDVRIVGPNEVDFLNGNGLNLLHNTTSKATHPAVDGQPAKQAATGTLVLDVDGQSVVSATYKIICEFE